MPKATAATQIQKLERALGVKLLNRTTRRVSVTPDGAAYYERCVAILDGVREAEESLKSQHAAPRGRLRVDVPTLMHSRTDLHPAAQQQGDHHERAIEPVHHRHVAGSERIQQLPQERCDELSRD